MTTPPAGANHGRWRSIFLQKMTAAQAGHEPGVPVPVPSRPGSPELSIWAWSLIAVGIVALRILIVSGGNPETAFALLQNLNVTAIVLATLSPFLAVLVAFFGWIAVGNYVRRYKDAPEPKWAGEAGQGLSMYALVIIILGVLLAALVYYAKFPTKILWALVGLWVVLRILRLCARIKSPVIFVISNLLRAIVVLASVIGATWLVMTQDRVWLPKEKLVIGGWWDIGVAYVLSSDEVWTKYLDDETRTVRVIPTKDVKARYPVTGG